MKNKKSALGYSSLTDAVHYIDGSGKIKDLPPGNFIQMMLLWMHEGDSITPVGSTIERTLSVDGKVHWRIQLTRENE